MKASSFVLESIMRNNKITDYLASKNILPIRQNGNRIFYLCPIHHETKPSFLVYLPDKIDGAQSYFCWGCKSNRSIIELYSKLENVGWKETITRLGADLNLEGQEEIDFIVNALLKEMESEAANDISSDVARISLNISLLGFCHMIKTEKDEDEIEFLEKLYKKVDDAISDCDIHTLRKIYDFVSDYNVTIDEVETKPFEYRFSLWEKKKEEENRKLYEAYK
jgi:CHC2 zinc finger